MPLNKADMTAEAIVALKDPRPGALLTSRLSRALDLFCSGPADDSILPEARVCARVIKGIVYPAGFLTLHGAVHHQGGSSDKVSEFQDVRIHSVAPIEITDFPGKVSEAKACSQEALIGPNY